MNTKNLLQKMILTGLLSISSLVFAASESLYPLDEMAPDLNNKASLQRGMAVYMNYCMGCHSLQYQRYKLTAEHLEIPEEMMLEHLIFDPEKRIGDLMTNSMKGSDAKNWFGVIPPDLTLQTRLRGGPEWLYTYMRTFYVDDSRPFGVNNLVFPNVGMPHVLADLQGKQEKVCKQIPVLADNGGDKRNPITGEAITEEKCGEELIERGYSPLRLVEGSGSLSPEAYDAMIYDLANFLYYTGEPMRQERERIGVYVLLFLAFFFVFAWLLHKEYWKDIH
ncbi:MAG: cytochrome c1 [Gammaproteobacteria bacterium]|nr:cytochrome c1 [Gammaproteobacteria bacterium]